MKKFLSAAAIVVALSGTAQSQDWDKAIAAYNNGDYATALQEWRPLAEQGNARAQNNLGAAYDYGEGVPQDYAEAVRWYRLAAEQGDALGQSNLGLMYKNGLGVPQDFVMAHMWFNLASANGHENAPEARNTVAEGMTPQDISTAQAIARECMSSNYQNCGH